MSDAWHDDTSLHTHRARTVIQQSSKAIDVTRKLNVRRQHAPWRCPPRFVGDRVEVVRAP